MRQSACRTARLVSVALAAVAVLLLSAPPASAVGPFSTPQWERAFDNITSMCGTATITDEPRALGSTRAWTDDNCQGALQNVQQLKVHVHLQFLGWDLLWHDCGEGTTMGPGSLKTAVAENTENCPTQPGWSYRSVTIHGGIMNGNNVPYNQLPLISPTLVLD
jgi:hypothetical protein